MKKIILLLLISFSGFAQKAIYNKTNESGKFTEYQTKDGFTLKVGDTITIGYPTDKNFRFITQGDLEVAPRMANVKVTVSKIKLVKSKTYVFFKGYGFNVAIDYEAALETGEIKNPFIQ